MKKLISTVCVVVTAVVMLTPTKTEAKNPTWELYGTDTHRKQYKPYSGVLGWFYRWRTEELKIIRVIQPGGNVEGYATHNVYYPYSMDPSDDNYVYNYVAAAYAKTKHLNSGDPNYRNIHDYHMVCGIGQVDQPRKEYPAVGMEAKAHMVGRQIDQISSTRREYYHYRTHIKVTDQRTTGGTKNFTLTVTYSGEGSARKTKISTPISLPPGGFILMTLDVPGRGKWASIVSIDVRENRPLEVPQPPSIQQGTPPGLPPTPPLPGPRRPRTQSEESPE